MPDTNQMKRPVMVRGYACVYDWLMRTMCMSVCRQGLGPGRGGGGGGASPRFEELSRVPYVEHSLAHRRQESPPPKKKALTAASPSPCGFLQCPLVSRLRQLAVVGTPPPPPQKKRHWTVEHCCRRMPRGACVPRGCHPLAAIPQAFMPGVHGGTAIADALFGDVNPGGKLPVTMYHSSYVHTADFLSMAMTNRSYKYYTGVPLYPFGYGLSYTEFRLDWAAPPPPLHVVRDEGERAAVYEVTVTNIGRVAGDEVVLAFTRPLAHTLRASLGDGVPIERQKLFAFERVALAAGQSAVLAFRVGPQQLAMVDADGHTALHKGEFDVVFSRGHGAPLMAKAAVARDSGAPQRLKSFRKWW